MCEMTEQEALERLRNGDAGGMTRLYEVYKPRIFSSCLHFTGNAFDAEDVTQEVFIQIFRKIGNFRGEAAFKTWVYKIALNCARVHARRQRRLTRFIVSDVDYDDLSSAKGLFYNPAHGLALIEAMSTLTPVRRKTLVLCDIHGLTHAEVARKLGATVVATKSRLHQAHVAIRRILQDRSRAFCHTSIKRAGPRTLVPPGTRLLTTVE